MPRVTIPSLNVVMASFEQPPPSLTDWANDTPF
jgi:hypothetical protein